MPLLNIKNVYKTYAQHVAVNNVSFTVPRGKIFGMLGPNGAGKTSLIRMITTITPTDKGEIYFDGALLNRSHTARIGYMPEERGLYKKMKVGEQLMYLGQLKGLSHAAARQEIAMWMQKFDIATWSNKKIEELSKGMQQKVQFIATVLHQPDLLILDEPFSGLDPINTHLIEEEIRRLNQNGTTIIFSTHRMEQVEEFCDEIILINRGENVLQGEVKTIKDRFKENLFEIEYSGNLPSETETYGNILKNEANTLVIQLNNPMASNELLQCLLKNGTTIRAFREILPTINEIFIRQVQGGK
jgi:ABC-2 type transport system ATP-binding protein